MMKLYPRWQSNLALFLVLTALVSGYFFLQLQKAAELFRKHSRQHSEVVAGVVELNIRNALSSSASLELIYRDFLKNSARFLNYLQNIEPFSAEELTAFAAESGLAGVRIVSGPRSVSGPAGWLPEQDCFAPEQLLFHDEARVYLVSHYSEGQIENDYECIIVGVAAEGLERIRRDLSLESLLALLNDLPGIAYVRLQPDGVPADRVQRQELLGRGPDGRAVAEHAISIGSTRLVVALEAEHFKKRMAQMRRELVLFVLFLLVIGGLSSWWLYRSQRTRLQQAREFERRLARQHEEAALGRAAATITHELRNPLNAIAIGLQRLQYEADSLSSDHRQLLVAMREAVERSNGVITRLRHSIHDFKIGCETVRPSAILEGVLALYRGPLADQGIELSCSTAAGAEIKGDRELLGQLFDNLLRNALEAQPQGGYLAIDISRQGSFWRLSMRNGGMTLDREKSGQLFEPYFTTKARGTGLGLAISRKIVEAHGGMIDWRGDFASSEFTLIVMLPVAALVTAEPDELRHADTDRR